MSDRPSLPAETIELIIDTLAESEYGKALGFSSIKACALVSHFFLPLCRKHIFAFITINKQHPWLSLPTTDDLHTLLSASPRIAMYIRTLLYHIVVQDFVNPWLSSMFNTLTRLKTVHILCSSVTGFDWISPVPRKALLTLLHLPTLTNIRLFRVQNFSLADLVGCTNLKELEINSLECLPENDGEFPERLPPKPVVLERFVESGEENGDTPRRLCLARRPDGKPIVDFSALKSITTEQPELDSMREIFGACRHLVSVNFIITECASSVEGLFIMLEPSLCSLKHIRLETGIGDAPDIEDPLSGLGRELEQMSGQNVIESIHLSITVTADGDCRRGDEWGVLDNALMTVPNGWPSLRVISLLITLLKFSRPLDRSLEDALKKLPETQFRRLVASERVCFNFEVQRFDL